MEERPAWRMQHGKGVKYHHFGFLAWAVFTKKSAYILAALLVFNAILFTGCTPKTSQVSLPIEPPESFSYSGDSEAPARWWTAFEDQKLDTLVSYALDSNFNLMATWQRLQAAEAIVEREESYLLPDIEASLQGATNYPQPDYVGGENLRFGLSAVYEADLWGRISSRVEAERYRAGASFFDYQTAAVSLSAEVASTWYRLLAAWQQQGIVEEQMATNEKILRLIRSRFGSGQVRGVDILRQQQLLEASREQLIIAESNIKTLEHQLAVLLGLPPQYALDYSIDTLPDPPPLPETGIPANLVRRRPDVQMAFFLLQAADREVAAALSNQYPRFAISGSVSVRANNVEDLFEDWAYSLAGNLLAPLFYGGRLSAEVDRSEAVKRQLLYEYGQTVLVAFQEVEDALILERKQDERIAVLEEQLSLTERAYEQLRIEYFNGMREYLDVLTALNQEQQLRRELIRAKLSLLEYRISLYRALAGGFVTDRESEAEVEVYDRE